MLRPPCNNLPPLNFGPLTLGDRWPGFAWGLTDPVTRQPVDLSLARARSHWRRTSESRLTSPPQELPGQQPPDPDLALTSAAPTGIEMQCIALEDGTYPLPSDVTFDDFMLARVSSDPLPMMGYPWIVRIEPITLPYTLKVSNYRADVKVDLYSDGIEVETFRTYEFSTRRPETRP